MSTAAAANPTYIIGHKNPDADSICAAIAYASYKEAKGESGFLPARCGNSNARIDTILTRFHQPLPVYISDVTPRVRDLMVRDVISVCQTATCAEALEIIDQHDVRTLPVVAEDNRVIGSVSVFQLGSFFVPQLREPREMRKVFTSLANISRALKAVTIHVDRPDFAEELFVRVGAMDVKSFGTVSAGEGIPFNKTIIIVGDRRDIQQRSIELGVRVLVVTGNLPVDADVILAAKAAGVSLMVSPYDSATTAWIIRSATTLERLVDRKFASLSADLRIGELRKKLSTSTIPSYMVVDDEGKLQGILTRTDVLKPVKTRLVLVDHNEMTQAVSGADQVTIVEIIDHHRLGSLNTQHPILFINEPVGSTCTIIADLFRRDGLVPSPDIAGIMMSGIISDTLHLNSPTTTEKDGIILTWLSKIAGVNSRELATELFNSGSVILANPPEKVIRSDFKIYEEDGTRFAVSQIEELGFGNFWKHSRELADALQALRTEESLLFACVLITDINTQNSLLLVKGEAEFISRINYTAVQKDEIFDTPGIVSRKKQLIPYIGSILKEMNSDGVMPTGFSKSAVAVES
ncbi:MAG: putative manganese-dependent inorganic diphosphatase [Opitutus sp.]|nr:putative manganese-dependent inorganic diphosphatase [Opitutus sp.]MCS6248204.1 putative manganese-dependent inorganic diphosphatase [Opitutus sp.]MCS6274786.1 putative manganese-dependent inorganic diphosphatase [Opitutus sp.]MCS6278219.1 putative manganese-dependent inorganic diphosphatase [Opitutus sp.]MCS6299329.1 putative manganese-dependent inorganic diphosphatase [Opitutus sp.]